MSLPWLPSPPSWIMGGACDPNGVLQMPELAMDLELLDDASEVLRGVADQLEPEVREPTVSPQMDVELLSWLTESGVEPTRTFGMVEAAASPLPAAWEAFRGGWMCWPTTKRPGTLLALTRRPRVMVTISRKR